MVHVVGDVRTRISIRPFDRRVPVVIPDAIDHHVPVVDDQSGEEA